MDGAHCRPAEGRVGRKRPHQRACDIARNLPRIVDRRVNLREMGRLHHREQCERIRCGSDNDRLARGRNGHPFFRAGFERHAQMMAHRVGVNLEHERVPRALFERNHAAASTRPTDLSRGPAGVVRAGGIAHGSHGKRRFSLRGGFVDGLSETMHVTPKMKMAVHGLEQGSAPSTFEVNIARP